MEDNTAGFVMMRAVLWANGEIFMQVCICIYVNFSFLLLFFWWQLKPCGQFGEGGTIRADEFLRVCVYGLFSVAK